MNEASPSVEDTPGIALAKNITASLQESDAGPHIPDEFAEDLAAGKVSPEDWRRLAEKVLEEGAKPQMEKEDV